MTTVLVGTFDESPKDWSPEAGLVGRRCVGVWWAGPSERIMAGLSNALSNVAMLLDDELLRIASTA